MGLPQTQQNYIQAQKTLQGMSKEISKILPNNLKPERFVRTSLTLLRNNQQLMLCDPQSFCLSVMKAAELGLDIGQGIDEAYIVPYKGKATLQIGYKGLLKLTRRGADVSDIYAYTVYKGDDFEVSLGSNPLLYHMPKFETTEPEYYYAVVKFKDGGQRFQVMSKEQVEAHKKQYAQGNSPAWKNSFDSMALKTVLKKICKTLPAIVEVDASFKEALEIEAVEPTPFSEPEKYMHLLESNEGDLGPSDKELAVKKLDETLDAILDSEVPASEVEKIIGENLNEFIETKETKTIIAATDLLNGLLEKHNKSE